MPGMTENDRKAREALTLLLDLHLKWLRGNPDGVRLDLQGANLRSANFQNVNLSSATLEGADLCYAFLRGAIMPDGTTHA